MITAIVMLSACSRQVTADSLEGVWVAVDGTTVRGLVIEPLDAPDGYAEQGYHFYLYEQGDAPVEVQAGLLTVIGEEVVYDVRSDVDPFNIGVRFASPLERLGRNQIRLEDRVYDRVDELPPGVTRTFGFGEPIHAVPIQANGGGIAVLDDGTAWTTTTFVSLGYGEGLGPDGSYLGRPELRDVATGLLSEGGDLGYATTPGGVLTRVTPTEVPPPTAGAQPSWAFETVWTASTTGCFHAADTPTAWVAICTNPGDLPGVEGPYAVLWHDPADGTVLHGVGFELPERLFTLGEDVLLQRTGPSPSPVHGERGAGPYGNLLERYRPDGTLAASWWFPQRVIVGDAAAIGPDLTVVSVQSVQDFPGSVPTASGTEPHAVVLALSADGPVWEHALTGRIHTPELLGVDGGVLVLTKGEGEDLGAGPLTDPDGEVGALVRMDACGRAVEQVVWTPDTDGATFHPRDLALDPAGDIVLQLASTGMYVLSPDVVLGDLDGGGLLGRFGKADTAIPACDDAPFAAVPPVVELELVGEATATLGTQVCTNDCSLTVDRFQELTLDVEAGDGWQVTGVSGACTELPCVLHADEPVTSVQVVVEATSALLVPSTGEVNALAAGATRGFVAGYCSPSVTVEIDGVVVADGPSGEGGYLGVLDTSGLVASTPLPTELGGPVITDLTALPGSDTGVVLLQSGAVHTFDATGILTTTQAPQATWRRIAVDGLGNIAVVGEQAGALRVAASDSSWTVDVPIAGTNQALALVGRAAGGFSAVGFLSNGATLPDTSVVTGSLGNLLLLHLDASGAITSGHAMPYQGGISGKMQAFEKAGQLCFPTTSSRSPSPPVGTLFVDCVDDTGSFVSTTAFDGVGIHAFPVTGGWVATGSLYSPTNPFGGPPLIFNGGTDLLVAWFDANASYLGAGSMGGTDFDASAYSPPPVAVLPDGTVFAHTRVAGGVASPWAIGIFSPP